MEVVASSDPVMGQVEGYLGNADNESVPENQVSALKDQEKSAAVQAHDGILAQVV